MPGASGERFTRAGARGSHREAGERCRLLSSPNWSGLGPGTAATIAEVPSEVMALIPADSRWTGRSPRSRPRRPARRCVTRIDILYNDATCSRRRLTPRDLRCRLPLRVTRIAMRRSRRQSRQGPRPREADEAGSAAARLLAVIRPCASWRRAAGCATRPARWGSGSPRLRARAFRDRGRRSDAGGVESTALTTQLRAVIRTVTDRPRCPFPPST